MSTPTESYLKVHYELRPAKQVERRMLIDSLQALMEAGFSIRNYQYTGMGSIYFIDFMLFHRVLGIKNMLSVEYSEAVKKRVEFNRPFDCVRTQIAPIGDVIPTLSKDIQHLLWLDYDGAIQSFQLEDVVLAATYLSVGSILLVTVDVEPPDDTDKPRSWKRYFEEQAGEYFNPKLKLNDFAKSQLPRRNIEFIASAIDAGMSGRRDVQFMPMFNFVYQDGHKMLTMGGMVVNQAYADKIRGSALARETYFRSDFSSDPCVINVPRLTRKERQYLDGFMPSPDNWIPKDFELDAKRVAAYRDIYRFCPTYAELML